MLRLTLFGHFRATLDNEPHSFPTQSVSALVAYLILEQRVPQPRAHVATLLWPDSTEAQGRRNLRQTLLRLRQTVPDTAAGDPFILTDHGALQWNPVYPAEIDVHQFERQMATAEPFLHAPLSETPYPAVAPLQAALALYSADLLLGFDLLNDFYAEWLHHWRLKYRRQALTGLARLANCYGRAGQPKRMEKLAQRQLAILPAREEAHSQLLQAYLAQGEYTAALNQYRHYEQHLQEVGLEPTPELQQLRQLARALRMGRSDPPTPVPHNLPPEETPFYGRQAELDDLLLWLVAPNQRLLTLKGLGGIGKTRLALSAARHLARAWRTIPPRFTGGVWFVSLADVEVELVETGTPATGSGVAEDEQLGPNAPHALVAEAIVESCGWQARPSETALATITRYLHPSPALLILDNLEHLPGMADFVLQLLTAVANLTILATSRHELGLQREVTRHLHGLPLPHHEGDTAVPSVTLLAERMQRVNSRFQLTTSVAPHLARICRTLEGWPLALELAASWAEVMDAPAIAAQVTTNIATLRTTMPDLPPRHRSIEAALAGSYALLSPNQQRVLARFALLRGGCTASAVAKVLATTNGEMGVLVRRALLYEHEGRYTIHELVRQFARDKLAQMGEQAAAEQDHAVYYLDLLRTLAEELHGPQPLTAIRQLRPERENIYRAWQWAAAHGRYEMITAVLPGLLRFYAITGLLREGETLIRETRTAVTQLPFAHDLRLAHTHLCLSLGQYNTVRALLDTLPPLESLSPRQQLEGHYLWGHLCIVQNRVPQSRHHYEQAVTLARALERPTRLIFSLMELHILSDYQTPYLTEVLALADELRDHWAQQRVYTFLGGAFIRDYDYNKARDYWQKALAIAQEMANEYGTATLHNNLGDALRELGKFEPAEEAFRQALALYESLHNAAFPMNSLEGWARLCVLRGDYEQAIALAQQAVETAIRYDRPGVQMVALSCIGHAYVGLELWAEAQATYERAVVLVPDLPHLAMESSIGLAYVAWQTGDETAVRTHIDHFLRLMEHSRLEGFASPAFNYGRAAEVLRGLGETEQAEALLAYLQPAPSAVRYPT
jgi:DNA-binding SARP family transcriptional activator/predicted ATPase